MSQDGRDQNNAKNLKTGRKGGHRSGEDRTRIKVCYFLVLIFIYLAAWGQHRRIAYLQHMGSNSWLLIAAPRLSCLHVGSWLPDQGSNPLPRHCKVDS